MPITAKETVLSFIERINAHDFEGLGALMSDDHTFIDAHGNQVSGREKMIVGWRGYFAWFPDYYIEVTDVFEEDERLAVWFRRRIIQRKANGKLAFARGVESNRERRPRDALAGLCRYEDPI